MSGTKRTAIVITVIFLIVMICGFLFIIYSFEPDHPISLFIQPAVLKIQELLNRFAMWAESLMG